MWNANACFLCLFVLLFEIRSSKKAAFLASSCQCVMRWYAKQLRMRLCFMMLEMFSAGCAVTSCLRSGLCQAEASAWIIPEGSSGIFGIRDMSVLCIFFFPPFSNQVSINRGPKTGHSLSTRLSRARISIITKCCTILFNLKTLSYGVLYVVVNVVFLSLQTNQTVRTRWSRDFAK